MFIRIHHIRGIRNGFNPVEVNMQPLHCVDSEYTAMYLALKEVHMNYDE